MKQTKLRQSEIRPLEDLTLEVPLWLTKHKGLITQSAHPVQAVQVWLTKQKDFPQPAHLVQAVHVWSSPGS